MLDKVKHVILVLSGKGGVGKSTFSSQLALALRDSGLKVGLLDIDLCGPNIPYLLNLEEKDVYQCDDGWVPIYTDDTKSLAVMSIGFLLKSRNEPIIWRGPKKTMMIKQFLNDVKWDDLDYLIIDTPPGTSDEHITVMECMKDVKCDGAIVVTAPHIVSVDDVRKELTFCRKTSINIMGIVENMSGFTCPRCSTCTNIFSSDGGKELARLADVPHLGTIPIDPRVNKLCGKSVITELPESKTAETFKLIVEKIISSL